MVVGGDYREAALEAYGRQCLHCGSTDRVKVHHMDGDHGHDRRDNWVPLCQECHLAFHDRAPPYTVWFALGRPVIAALDELRAARGCRSRSEAVSRLLLEAGSDDLDAETWALLSTYVDALYPSHRRDAGIGTDGPTDAETADDRAGGDQP